MIYSEKVIDQMEVQIAEQLLEIDELKGRIAELEGEVSHLKHINKNWSISEGLALQRIAELEKDLKKYDKLAWDDLSNPKTIWCDCGDGITADSGAKCGVCASTPQTKPLSDEEIKAIANNLTCTPDKNWNVLFAKAILKKASEK